MPGKTHRVAEASEARFIIEAMKRGWEVARPISYAEAYDFVIRHEGSWKSVQVKSVYEDETKRKVNLRRSSGRSLAAGRQYKPGDFDLLFAVDGERCWMIPYSVVAGHRSSICLGSGKYDTYLLAR